MGQFEINFLSLMAGFGVGAVVGELIAYFRLLSSSRTDAACMVPGVGLVIFAIIYLCTVNWHSISLTFLGAALFHLALFAKKKCLAQRAEL